MSGATNEVSALAGKIDAPEELVLTPFWAIPQNPALGPVVTARIEPTTSTNSLVVRIELTDPP